MDSFVGSIKQALSRPWGAVDITLGVTCSVSIYVPGGGVLANLCLVNKIAGLSSDVGEDLLGKNNLFSDDNWKIQNDYCGNINENE